MLQFLAILFFAVLFLFLLGVMLFTSAILSFIRKVREMVGRNPANDPNSRDYTGRRQQQYAYRDGKASSSTTYSEQDETIIDTRSGSRSNKKIFDDDEGEYVDFVEE